MAGCNLYEPRMGAKPASAGNCWKASAGAWTVDPKISLGATHEPWPGSGKTWKFVAWIGSEPKGYAIIPSHYPGGRK
jgi:hypothetical protein